MTITTFGLNTGNSGGTESAQNQEGAPTTNDPSGASIGNLLEAHRFGAGDFGDAVVRFTGITAAIAGGSTVNSAKVRMYLGVSSGSDTGYAIGLFKLLRVWVQNQETWNIYSTGNSWTTPGALGNGTDRDSSAMQSLVIGDSAINNYYEWATSAAMVAWVQGVVDGASNDGFLMERTDATSATARRFISETGTDTFRPELVVDWTAGSGGVPAAWIKA